jgi:RHS repeat-associated protein
MKPLLRIATVACLVSGLVGDASANNPLNTSYRAGTISPPNVDDSPSNASSIGVNQGRPSYSVPFELPPGRAGVEPSLSLVYDGGRDEDVVGAGWHISVPSIRVRTSGRGGQPNWGVAVRYLGITGEELVELGDELADQDGDGLDEPVYREERDTQFIRYVELSMGGWRIDYPDGRKLMLGTDPQQRIARVDEPDHVSQWLPETLQDPSGNQLLWIWRTADEVAADVGTIATSDVARYLGEMRWGCRDCAGASTYQSVELDYVGVANNVLSFWPGYLVEYEFQLSEIASATVVGGSATPVRTYTLGYDLTDTRRVLTSVATVAADGSSVPPLELGYTTRLAGAVSRVVGSPPATQFDAGTQFVDMDLDGRLDVVKLGNVGGAVTYFRHDGTTEPAFAAGQNVTLKPGVSLTANGSASADDATNDLAVDVMDVGTGFLYPHNHAGGWSPGIPTDLPALANSADAVRGDFNGDGYGDLLDTGSDPWELYLDDGSHSYLADHIVFDDETTPSVGAAALRGSSAGVLFGNLDADGLVDVVYLDPAGTSAHVFYGRGRGGFGWLAEDGRAIEYSTFTITSSSAAPVRNSTMLVDIDGDALGDLVTLDAAASRVRVWKRVPGSGFTDIDTSGPFTQNITAANGCRVVDVDLDAVADVICGIQWKRYDWADQVPFLLSEVDNGRGSVTRLSYTTTAREAAAHAAAGTPWTRNVSMAMPIIASMEVDDSRGNVAVTHYRYRDAHFEIDELEDRHQFVGFGYIATEQISYLETTPGDPATRVEDPQDPGVLVRSFFDVGEPDYAERGMLDCEETWSRTQTPTSYTCDVSADGPLSRRVQTHSWHEDADDIVRVQVDAEDRYVLEGGATANGEIIRTEYEFDELGNRTVERRFGTAAPGDEEMIVTDYVRNEEDWLIRLVRVVERGDMDTSGATPTLVRAERACFVYDGVDALCNASYGGGADDDVELGLVTAKQRYTDDDLLDGAPGTMETVEQIDYTDEGLPELVTDAALVVTEHVYDPAFELFAASTTLDPGGLALQTQFEVSTKHGVTTRVTQPDGTSTRATYDDLGRMTSLAKPGDSLAAPTLSRTYVDGAPISTITEVQKDGTPDGLIAVSELDGAGRLLCRRKEAVGQPDIEAQREYTGRGLVALEYLPVKAASCDVATRSSGSRTSARRHTSVDYDALSRPVTTTHMPSGAFASTLYGVLQTTIADEEDTDPSSTHFETPKRVSVDGLGRTIEVDEWLDADRDGSKENFTTSYAYGPHGLVAVEDLLGAVIFEARHDSRGRTVWTRDADRGEETTQYDAMDRVDTVVDARGDSVAHTYDAAGRIESAITDDGTALETTTYHYDQHPSGAAMTSQCHSVGRLAWVEEPSGQSVFCYDSNGRTTRDDTTISSYSATPFTTRQTWDSLGRLKTLTHPDNTKLTYLYDAGGRPNSLAIASGATSVSLVTGATYDGAGRLTRMNYGNGAVLDFDHDDRGRPTRHAASLGGTVEFDATLTLDGVGNVEAITDTVGARSGAFVYDDWNRLVHASGSFLAGESVSYAYDPRGNMLAAESSDPTAPISVHEMAYGDGTAVHALTSVDRDGDGVHEESFDYDGTGNLAEDGTYGFEFDARGMLREVAELGSPNFVEYTYDHAGRRVATEFSTGDAIYYVRAADAEVRRIGTNTVMRKHIGFAGRSIGAVQGTFTNANKATKIFLFATDHLGSPALVFDIAAAPSVVERWAGYPFGGENTEVLAAEGTLADYRAPWDPQSKLLRRFQGREIDPLLPDFYDFGARVYRSDLGRFLAADSMVPEPGDSQSWNRYAFVRNNPLGRIDPTGNVDGSATSAPPICTGLFPTGLPSSTPAPAATSQPWNTPGNGIAIPDSFLPVPPVLKGVGFLAGQAVGAGRDWLASQQWSRGVPLVPRSVIGAMDSVGEWLQHPATQGSMAASWDVLQVGGAVSMTRGISVAAAFEEAGNAALGAPRMTTVSSWADAGIRPDLSPGRWVQLGGPTRFNFARTGLIGPKAFPADQFPFVRIEGPSAPFSNSVTGRVPMSSLQWPPGVEMWKGVLGQRVLGPTSFVEPP